MGTPSSMTRTGKHEPWELQVSRGQIAFHETLFKFGENVAVSTTFETIWTGGGLYTYPTSAANLGVVSTAAADTTTRIKVIGLDDDYNEIEEKVTVNGTTTVTTNSEYLRVYRAYVSANEPAGNINITHSGTLSAQIVSGTNQTLMTVYTVPAGYTLYVGKGHISSGTENANKYVTGEFKVRPFGGVFRTQARVNLSADHIDFNWEYPIKITEKSDVEARAKSSSGDQGVAASFQGVLIKNEIPPS